MILTFDWGSNSIILASTQLPPDAPVSNRVLITVLPISTSAEHLKSGRTYPESLFPTVPPWLDPLASENPVGRMSKPRSRVPRSSLRPHTRDVVPTCRRMGKDKHSVPTRSLGGERPSFVVASAVVATAGVVTAAVALAEMSFGLDHACWPLPGALAGLETHLALRSLALLPLLRPPEPRLCPSLVWDSSGPNYDCRYY